MAIDRLPRGLAAYVRQLAALPSAARRARRERDPGLRGLASWSVWWVLSAAFVGVAAVVAATYLGLGWTGIVNEGTRITTAQRITTSFAVATALGVLVALVVNLRRQHLAEQGARLEIAAAFTERFRSAAAQLSGSSAAERIAGVYAMAALADEYPSRRQQCVDVLCGYLRLPFDPGTDRLAGQSITTTQIFHDGRTVVTSKTAASTPFDQQVRQTITTLIRDRTQPDTTPSWSHLNFDLSGAHLSNLDLSRSHFSGDRTSFSGATFSGDTTSFEQTTFLSYYDTSFSAATFASKITSFFGATFCGDAWFDGATFSGDARIYGATFSGNASFHEATFSGNASFHATTFSGEIALFSEATFSGEKTSFARTTFSSATTLFTRATFSGEQASFDEAAFPKRDGDVVRSLAREDYTSFDGATFRRVQVTFDQAEFAVGVQVEGLEDPVLEEGAGISRCGVAFRGWPEPLDGKVISHDNGWNNAAVAPE